jgi:serine/threonine-protein kinase
MGTAAYLSPEQAQGLSVDSRSDLYSTGVVLFELLTRRPPFVADAPVAVAFAHVNEPPPVPSAVDPTLPLQVDPIVARALAKDPAQRYQTAVEFRADVERAIAGVPVTRVMPVPPRAGPDAQATSVLGGIDPYATAAMAATAAGPTGAMPPVIPGGAGDPYAAPDPMATTAQVEPARKGGVLKGFSIAALIIALLGVGVWLGVRLLGSTAAETVAVPRLEGLTVAKAESALRDVGLLLGGPEVKVSDLPKDTIISQDPRTGELVAVGSIVDVVVSAGKEQVQVPDLIDFTSESDARRALAEAGLTLGQVTPEDSDRPAGTVLRQEPAPYETVDAGSAVDIWVSNAQVEVPNVVGRTEAQARTDLFNLGFEVAYGPELETTEFAPGTVADQTPVGGEKAKKGSLVTLTLAKAPAPTPTPTPTPSVPADGGGADGTGGGGTANGNPGLSATPAP